jgi:hypothetical protein
MQPGGAEPVVRILTCSACGEHFRIAGNFGDGWATCPRCGTRFEIAPTLDDGSTAARSVADAEAKQPPSHRQRFPWLWPVLVAFAISALLGLSAGIAPVSAAGVICCGPVVCLGLAIWLGLVVRRSLEVGAFDHAVDVLVLILLTTLFALALLVVLFHTCAAVVMPANLR